VICALTGSGVKNKAKSMMAERIAGPALARVGLSRQFTTKRSELSPGMWDDSVAL
jgi:hypothetical protein